LIATAPIRNARVDVLDADSACHRDIRAAVVMRTLLAAALAMALPAVMSV